MSIKELFKHCFSSLGLKVALVIPENIGQLSVHNISTNYFELLAYKLCTQISTKRGDNCKEILLNFIFRTYFIMRSAPSNVLLFFFTFFLITYFFPHFFIKKIKGLAQKRPKNSEYFSPITLYGLL